MSDRLRLSAKNLGELALPGFCPRCAWIKLRYRLPYQVFPGIFSSIDSYTKKVVHSWIDRYGKLPEWLSDLGRIDDYIDPPHHSTFRLEIPEYGILLTGAPDGMLKLADGSIAIIDYKTPRYTEGQDRLLPMYEVQLNSYALIAEGRGYGRVTKLALVYAEPVTDKDAAEGAVSAEGFAMGFSVSIHPVGIDPGILVPLFQRAREIYDLPHPPPGREGCEDCRKLDSLIGSLAGG